MVYLVSCDQGYEEAVHPDLLVNLRPKWAGPGLIELRCRLDGSDALLSRLAVDLMDAVLGGWRGSYRQKLWANLGILARAPRAGVLEGSLVSRGGQHACMPAPGPQLPSCPGPPSCYAPPWIPGLGTR